MKQYDVIVIGSGGGAKITTPASKLRLKVACIEENALGGTCLNRGCIPSKMLIHPADVATTIKEASKFDINAPLPFNVNFTHLIERISKTVDADSAQIKTAYEKNPNIDFYQDHAKFVANKIIQVGDEVISADKIFIAVGCRPQIPSIEGLKETPFMTSTEALRNTKLPQKLIVIGAGYIAVELGYAYQALGCEVHFLVRSQFLKSEDKDIVEEFSSVFSKNHYLHLGCLPIKVEYKNNTFTVYYQNSSKENSSISADSLLIAAGIVPNTDNLGLERTNIKVNKNGFIHVDEYLQTTVKDVYAFGDCIGRYFYRHTVNFEGEYLFKKVFLNKENTPIKYPPVPHAIFTHPQIAAVGKTEEELIEEGVDYVVGLNPYKSSAMGMALLSDHGFCKILIDRHSQKILGAHIIGDEASDMIHMLIAFMNKDGTLDDLLNMIYIHPALPEIIRNAARKARTLLEQ